MLDPITAPDWARMAREERSIAEDLASLQRWKAAFYHSGLAIEFALKRRIMLVRRLDFWPDDRELHTHNLSRLAQYAGLTEVIDSQAQARSELGIAWSIAKEWSVTTRYDPQAFSSRQAVVMLEAVGEKGLLEWLLTP